MIHINLENNAINNKSEKASQKYIDRYYNKIYFFDFSNNESFKTKFKKLSLLKQKINTYMWTPGSDADPRMMTSPLSAHTPMTSTWQGDSVGRTDAWLSGQFKKILRRGRSMYVLNCFTAVFFGLLTKYLLIISTSVLYSWFVFAGQYGNVSFFHFSFF